MNADSKKCEGRRITRFLQHEMAEAELNEFVRHLDGCSSCSERLEAEVVGKNWWDLAGEYLADSDYELEPLSDQTAAPDVLATNLMVQQVLDHLAPTDDPQMLGRIGSYEISGVVGSGGMGVVLKAFDRALDRSVAVKTLSPVLASSGAARKRFSREARAAAAVVHDNVIEIYGVAEADNLPYLVMPYVRGTSLQRRLDDSGPLSTAEVLRVGMQTAAGLAAAHAQGLVHRDIKPGNILLSEGVERVLITDFGLARAADDASLTKTGVIAGTPQYMSPEQARGEAVDQRSDLFSLGSVMYTMCTGRAPFRAETSYGVLRRITDEEPRPIREINPEIPEWLCRIIGRLMAKQPEDRFESAGEVAELLEECLAHVQQPTTVPLPASVASPARGGGRLKRWAAVAAVFGFACLGLFWWHASDPPEILDMPAENHVAPVAAERAAFELDQSGDEPSSGGVNSPTATQAAVLMPGIYVRLLLSAETHSREMMERNVGYDELSIHATGITIDGKKDDNVFAVLAHDCRLDSFHGTTHLGEEYWDAEFFVPRGADSHYANHTVSQEQFDKMKSQGAQFELDHHRDQFPGVERRLKPLRRLAASSSSQIAYSADGSRIAVANGDPRLVMRTDGTSRIQGSWMPMVEILNGETGKGAGPVRLNAIEGLSHFTITAVAFSPDGNLLAVGTSIGQVLLYDVSSRTLARSLDDETGRLADSATVGGLKSIPRAVGSVASLAFSPDGKLLAVCGGAFSDVPLVPGTTRRLTRSVTGPGRLKLWDVKTGSLRHDLAGHSHAAAVGFSPDGSLLASAGRWSSEGDDGNGAILWNVESGSKIRTIAVESNGGTQSLAFSFDGKLLALGTEHFDKNAGTSTGTVSLTHVSTGIVDWQQTVPCWAKPVGFLPDGKRIAVLWGQQSVQLLDSATGDVAVTLRSADFHKGGRWNDLAIVPDRQLLAIAGNDYWSRGFVEEWDLAELNSQAANVGTEEDAAELSPADDESQGSAASAVWQDDLEPRFLELDSELDAFEDRAGRPWDDGPVHDR